ncbi:MAG: dicarboxylate/amino acid:cation symporter [Bacilli bacterium]|nr:dicarboxylate/amino acid:cation symporter [Bacilli bacterium]
MKNIIKNYKDALILVGAIIIGVIVGLIFKEDAKVLAPLGDIFINMLLVIIVPLIFLTITTSIAKMNSPKRLGKIMITTIITFIVTSLIAVVIGFVTTYSIDLVNVDDANVIKSTLVEEEVVREELSILERTTDVLTVESFNDLLTTDNLIALLVFSVLFGLALNMTKERGEPVKRVLDSLNEVIMKLLKIIMYYAPIGLGCYAASLVGTFGSSIAVGYLKTFIVYTFVAILFYFVVYTIYAFIAGGMEGVKRFWKNIIPATVTSIVTCSSAASIPVNSMCAKNIGVSDDIAETVVPLGTSFHKDGSIIGSVFKIMFLVCLFGTNIDSFGGIGKVLLVALVATLLVTAVPIGGGTISEMMIITLMGYSTGALPILTIIATIIDPPATMLNVVGDSASSMIVARVVDGKNWIKKKK